MSDCENFNVAILIPWKLTDSWRQFSLDWLLHHYAEHHPSWRVFVGDCSSVEPKWIKAIAVEDAVHRAERDGFKADIYVVADADSYVSPDALNSAVAAVALREAEWAQPFRVIVRLNAAATKLLVVDQLRVAPPATIDAQIQSMACDKIFWEYKPYAQDAAGGIVVVRADVWRRVPLDPRFEGFGGEDFSWADALTKIVGKRKRIESKLVHFYHTPQARISRSLGSDASGKLRREYQRVRTHNVRLLKLVNEARRILDGIRRD